MPLVSLEQSSCRQETRRRLERFHGEAVRRWGTLTPGGAICHLALCYELVVDGGRCSERTGLLERTVIKSGALRVPVRWPQGYATMPELVEGEPGVRSQGVVKDRARVLAAFDRFAAARTIAGRAHPVFGSLTHWEWMRWGYLHADHHLRQFGL